MDALVEAGRFPNRTEAIRHAITALLRDAEQRRIDAEIAAGYRRIPPTTAELAWADRAGQELIAEEPW